MTTRRSPSGCDDFRAAQRLSRREALRIGGLGGLGLTLPQLLATNANAASKSPTFGRAKRVIMLYLHGGHPQQETFDPKPEGPSAVRGEFGAIATSVTGVRFSEVLPQIAKRMHRLAIVRSMSHENPNHVQACLPANTGHKHPPGEKRGDFPPSDTDFPPFGAVLDHLRESRSDASFLAAPGWHALRLWEGRGERLEAPRPRPSKTQGVPPTAVTPAGGTLPTWVRVGPLMRRNNGTVLHGQLPGFLGAKHMHFAVDQKLTGRDVRVEAVQPADDLTAIRLSARRDLLRQFDAQRRLIDESATARRFDVFTQKAFSLLSSPATRTAFNLAAESPATRARYGDTEFGQRCLLARRLAEAGVPMVNVSYCHTPRGSWDTHSRNFTQMKRSLAPTLDTAFSALLDDLADRRLLDETLVIVNAEFGRTPKINRNAGRDHWPWVYSLALSGAGLRPGVVHGASDTSAAYPTAHPHDPADMAATIYHLLGVDPKTTLYDKLRRPQRLVIGEAIGGILG